MKNNGLLITLLLCAVACIIMATFYITKYYYCEPPIIVSDTTYSVGKPTTNYRTGIVEEKYSTQHIQKTVQPPTRRLRENNSVADIPQSATTIETDTTIVTDCGSIGLYIKGYGADSLFYNLDINCISKFRVDTMLITRVDTIKIRELIPADVPWYDHFSIGAGVVGAGVLIFSILK